MAITGTTDLGNGQLAMTVSHDPTAVATDAPAGTLIIDTNGFWYKKLDAGSTTNVQKVPGTNISRSVDINGLVTNNTTASWSPLLTTTFTTRPTTTALLITVTASIRNSNSGNINMIQLVVAATPIRASASRCSSNNTDTTHFITARVATTGSTSVTVTVNWRPNAGTATIDPTLNQNTSTTLEHATVTIQEVAE